MSDVSLGLVFRALALPGILDNRLQNKTERVLLPKAHSVPEWNGSASADELRR
jgi:hypothetical protein